MEVVKNTENLEILKNSEEVLNKIIKEKNFHEIFEEYFWVRVY